MRIVLNDIHIFCLTCEGTGKEGTGKEGTGKEGTGKERNGKEGTGLDFLEVSDGMSKREHIESIMKTPFEFVHPIMGIQKNKSGASGFFRMIENGLKKQVRGEPFRPFLMVEDDISFETGEKTVEIPDDADILYVGLSNCSMNDYMFHYANYYESVYGYGEVVRVKHMLASHGIMVCSALGAAAIQRTMLEVFLSDKPWDVPLAYLQPHYRVYALRRPWVYQDANYGGDEACTRIRLMGADNPLPIEWVTKEYITLRLLF
jgi:hypothetical protein